MNGTVRSEDVIKAAKPLDPILADESVWGIMVDRYDRVLVDYGDKVEQVDSPFGSVEELRTLIDDLFGLYSIKLDANNPVGHLRLPDHSRAMAIVPPNAVDGPHLVLRRMPGTHISWEQVIGWGSVTQRAYDLLKSAVHAQVNTMISGSRASGKYTLTNLIAELAPPEDRLVTAEKEYELLIKHPRVVRLEAGGPAGLTLEDVLEAAIRMRPDRLIVGELDGPVAATVLQHFGTGLAGSMTVIYGTSVADALNRLESFCMMANLGLGLTEIRHLIAAGLGLVTYQEQLPDGSRKLVEIVELRGVQDHRYVLQPLMRYNRETNQSEFPDVKPSWEQ